MRCTLLFLTLLLSTDASTAQRSIAYGYRVGATLSSIALDYGPTARASTNRGPGFEAAFIAEVTPTDVFGVVAEVGVSMRSYSYTAFPRSILPGGRTSEQDVTTAFNTLSLGALGRLFPGGQSDFGTYFTAGPRMDILLGRITFADTQADSLAPLLARFSVSGLVGLGLALEPPGWPDTRVEFAYRLTLTDFLDDPSVRGTVDSFGLGVSFVW
ncbi:MAG: hypothetical protein AAF089_00145 [Bacteroidota bacterium]